MASNAGTVVAPEVGGDSPCRVVHWALDLLCQDKRPRRDDRDPDGARTSGWSGHQLDVQQTRRMTRPKRPRDTNQLAKMIVDLTTRTTTENGAPSRGRKKSSAAGKVTRKTH